MRNVKIFWHRLKKKIIPPFVAFFAHWGIRAILKTCKIEIHGKEHLLENATKEPCILALWHNRLAPTAPLLERFAPMFTYAPVISNSRDGELLVNFTKQYKQCQPIRVVHKKRHQALTEMIDTLQKKRAIIVITPDGPRGPPYKVKPGIFTAAKATKAKIIPFTWQSSLFWELNTWDRMRIPKPFSKVTVTVGEPLATYGSEDEKSHEMIEKELHFSHNSL